MLASLAIIHCPRSRALRWADQTQISMVENAGVASGRRAIGKSPSIRSSRDAAGYPPLRNLIEDSRLAVLVLGHYLLRELVEAACSTASPATTYWFDTVTGCEVDEESIALHGLCYSSAQYTDRT